jgi:protoporphyrinogen oxidase
VILGAGLAGLSAALRLRRGFRLVEAGAEPGGLARTAVDSGYRFDRTGHLLHLADARARRLVFGLIGDRLLHVERRARVFSHGVHTPYPFQANLHGLPPSVAAECLRGFVEAWAARGGRRARAADFEGFIQANFGPGIARHFMIPYNRKLWGLHPREITDDWCERFVPTPGLTEVVDGAVGLPQERMGYNARFCYPRGGIGELPAAMTARVGTIELGTRPRAIDFRRRRIDLGRGFEPYRALIAALPLDALAALLVDPPASVRRAATGLRCRGLRYLDVALTRPAGNDHHWSYVPERRFPFYRVGAYSNFSVELTPPGRGSLYVELASRSPVRLDRLRGPLVEGLRAMGLIRGEGDIAFVRPRFLPRAYVIYDGRRRAAVELLLCWLEEQGIFAAGRYGRWEYAAMEDALIQGIQAADRARGAPAEERP